MSRSFDYMASMHQISHHSDIFDYNKTLIHSKFKNTSFIDWANGNNLDTTFIDIINAINTSASRMIGHLHKYFSIQTMIQDSKYTTTLSQSIIEPLLDKLESLNVTLIFNSPVAGLVFDSKSVIREVFSKQHYDFIVFATSKEETETMLRGSNIRHSADEETAILVGELNDSVERFQLTKKSTGLIDNGIENLVICHDYTLMNALFIEEYMIRSGKHSANVILKHFGIREVEMKFTDVE